MQFNKTQQKAVEHFKGPCLALAGPGSGKTTVLTHRILHLIKTHKASPKSILVITFTKMAAEEMKERFYRISEGQYKDVTFGTFHSVFFMILKYAYNYTSGNIIRQEEQYRFIYNILFNYSLELTDTTEFAKNMLALIGRIKGSSKTENELDSLFDTAPCPKNVAKDIYYKYQKYLTDNKKIDFEDMMVYCYELFMERKDILNLWQERFLYILIDEFQDINNLQYEIVLLLAKKYRNLFIVGDDDQSIYGFRGAKPDFMRAFREYFKEAELIRLSVNYRCQAGIVYAAKSVVDKNKNRFKKDITPAEGKAISKDSVIICEFETELIENNYIVQKIKEIQRDLGIYKEIAVLVRTNTGAGLLIQELVKQNIPFITKEHINDVFSHWIARDILSYITLAMGKRDRKYFFQIMNKPLRYISREAFEDEEVSFDRLRAYYSDKEWLLERIDILQSDIEFIGKMRPFAAVNYIRKAVGYDDYLKKYAKEQHIEAENLINVLNELQQSASDFSTFKEWFDYIEDYRLQLKTQSQQIKNENEQKDGVQICTMHGSKGLEYDTVFVLDVNDGIIPFHKAVTDMEIEEERRMFYVAMTRAKQKLYLCISHSRCGKKMEKSRFIEEMDKSYAQHEKYLSTAQD